MKRLLMIVMILGVAAAIGYLVGTESGRTHRDKLLARARRTSTPEDATVDSSDSAEDAEVTKAVAAVSG